jgi:hypothetical protein
MTHAVRFAVRNDQPGFDRWLEGSADPPKFGNSVDLIGRDPAVAAIEATLTGGGLFGVHSDGVLRSLYTNVCRYAHSQPGHTKADIWQSNGPVFVSGAFTQFWLDFCDVLLASYVLLKIGYPGLRLPAVVDGVVGNAADTWHGLASTAMAAYFG